jgi:hypothetical protein
MLIAYYLGFTNRKRKYVEEKTTATLKSKQTSITTVRKHLLTVVSLLTPLILRYPLPLIISDDFKGTVFRKHLLGPHYKVHLQLEKPQ